MFTPFGCPSLDHLDGDKLPFLIEDGLSFKGLLEPVRVDLGTQSGCLPLVVENSSGDGVHIRSERDIAPDGTPQSFPPDRHHVILVTVVGGIDKNRVVAVPLVFFNLVLYIEGHLKGIGIDPVALEIDHIGIGDELSELTVDILVLVLHLSHPLRFAHRTEDILFLFDLHIHPLTRIELSGHKGEQHGHHRHHDQRECKDVGIAKFLCHDGINLLLREFV